MRRHRTLPPKPQNPHFTTLPDDILIAILSQCPIPDLLTLRLVSPRTRTLITEYISTIAPSSARATFSLAELLLTRPDAYTLEWLKSLIPRQLAAILVDRYGITSGDELPQYRLLAEDARGEVLRARIADGWRVLRRLSNISRDVYKMPLDDAQKTPLDRLMHQFRSKAKTQQQKKGAKQQKEDIILQKRLEYIKTLPVERAQDYRLTITLLSSAFRTSPHNTSSSHKRWVFDWGGGIDGPRQIRKGESWLTWFILSEGPDLFWNQWQDPSHAREHYIRDRAIAVWEQTNKDLVDYQRGQAKQVVEALNERACIETQFERVNLSLYFREYAELRFKREREEGVDEIRDTTGDVWFFVEFQWPEELRRMGELEEEWRVERGSVR